MSDPTASALASMNQTILALTGAIIKLAKAIEAANPAPAEEEEA